MAVAQGGVRDLVESADRDVSQIHSKGMMMALGKSAHSHAAELATCKVAMRVPA